MDKLEIIEELEYEVVMCEKTGNNALVPGLLRAINIIKEL